MDIKQLEYFRQVAELGSFSRASAFLDIAQPALSRQIRQLEIELHASLFERTGRGVTLTAAGTRLLKHSRAILRQIDLARADIDQNRDIAEGRLVLGWPPSFSRTATVPLVEAFREQFPRVTLCLVEGLSTHILEWLSIGRLDCGVVYNTTPTANVDLLPLSEEPLFLISPRAPDDTSTFGGSIKLEALAELQFIMPPHPNNIRLLLEQALATVERKVKIRYEIESIPAAHELVRRGYGHVVLPMNAIDVDLCRVDNLLSVRAIEPELVTTLWLATSTHRPCNLLTQQALRIIDSVIREEIRHRSVALRSLMLPS